MMIDDVSNRIRNIINSQNYTPKKMIFKSRENSTQKEESIKSKKNIRYPPKTPQPKFKRKETELDEKEWIPSKSTTKEGYLAVEDFKLKVLSIIEPLLYEMEKRIIQKLIKMENQYIYTSQMIQDLRKSQLSLPLESTFGRKSEIVINQQVIEEIYNKIQPLKNENRRLQEEIKGLKLNLNQKIRDVDNESRKKGRCKCEHLVEEILRSQNHLMMELKYIKHFREKEVIR